MTVLTPPNDVGSVSILINRSNQEAYELTRTARVWELPGYWATTFEGSSPTLLTIYSSNLVALYERLKAVALLT